MPSFLNIIPYLLIFCKVAPYENRFVLWFFAEGDFCPTTPLVYKQRRQTLTCSEGNRIRSGLRAHEQRGCPSPGQLLPRAVGASAFLLSASLAQHLYSPSQQLQMYIALVQNSLSPINLSCCPTGYLKCIRFPRNKICFILSVSHVHRW